ncbi:hypothetical protein IFM89_038966 [Coptis chinensis]|uniref:Uncharacterized protein n=1 Tax=Coptis chinensis TaxID=261450 RepID=A0A835J054_9MAGN|nr:hypothetical protein IFM89_038966 [Coptis chinensis]
MEAFERSKPFTEGLIEKGVIVVPFATDGNLPKFEVEESEERRRVVLVVKRIRDLGSLFLLMLPNGLVQLLQVWLDEQKKLANVSPDSPVYISLRLDGRVRGSGLGYPPWNALVAQLPPVKGMWSGLFDGFDGRV